MQRHGTNYCLQSGNHTNFFREIVPLNIKFFLKKKLSIVNELPEVGLTEALCAE
jgi:hypothetical protein